MKGGRKHKETGGANEAEEDVKLKPANRSYTGTSESDSGKEAEEKKKGGRVKKKRGGGLHEHHAKSKSSMSDGSSMKVEHAKKEVGVVSGPEPPAHAGKKARKAGGRAAFASGGASNEQPFSSARKGKDAPNRKLMKGEMGYGET
jgi:hypothetical protein